MKKQIIHLLAFVSLASCSKNLEKNGCNLDIASLAGSYRVTEIIYKSSPSAPDSNYYDLLLPDACERDDILILNLNRTYVFTDVGITCSPSGNFNGKWSLHDSILWFDYYQSWSFLPPLSGYSEKIEDFNCSTLTLADSSVFIPGDKLIKFYTRQ